MYRRGEYKYTPKQVAYQERRKKEAKRKKREAEKIKRQKKKAAALAREKKIRHAKTWSSVVVTVECHKRVDPIRYGINIEYDFLQYERLVRHWAKNAYGLSQVEIDMLRYIYPLKTFTKSDFTRYCGELRINYRGKFESMFRKGWIKEWSERGWRRAARYTLSTKANKICKEMHLMCVGKKEIPTLKNTPKKLRENRYLNLMKKVKKVKK